MENPLAITMLNDFIFYPASLYFHNLEAGTDNILLKSSYQINGTHAHKAIDSSQYSDKIMILQGATIYSSKYNLIGKIDIYDAEKCILTERKNRIINIYDGYIFQLYGQYFGLIEMGYKVEEIRLYSKSDNKVYKVDLPSDNFIMLKKFEKTINTLKGFSLETFKQSNLSKCQKCIYEELCIFSKVKEENI